MKASLGRSRGQGRLVLASTSNALKTTSFLGLALVAAAVAAGCDRTPSADGLRDWTVQDHEQDQESAKAQLPKKGDGGAGGVSGIAALVDLTWRAQCAQCHGESGRGDGPNGPMVKATNFTDPEWQRRMQDGEIANAILNGKGKMPKFELSNELVVGLVLRIRQVGGQAGGASRPPGNK